MRAMWLVVVGSVWVLTNACVSPKSGQDRVDASDAAVDVIDEPPVCPPSTVGGGSIYAVDSTQTLFAFDEVGNPAGKVRTPSPIGNLNGGGIAYAGGNVYVTIGQPTSTVSAFSAALSPQTLSKAAFSGLALPRGIAFDEGAGELFVTEAANGGAQPIGVFEPDGTTVTIDGSLPNSYGASGIAYDPDHGTLWIANYPGAPLSYGVAEYTRTAAAAQTFDYSTQFVSPGNHQESYSIAVCPKAVTQGSTLVVVGFIDDGTGLGTGAVQAYSTDGTPVGPAHAFAKPYSLSCNSVGRVYVGDKAGLFMVDILAGVQCIAAQGAFPGLKAPIFGVLARD